MKSTNGQKVDVSEFTLIFTSDYVAILDTPAKELGIYMEMSVMPYYVNKTAPVVLTVFRCLQS